MKRLVAFLLLLLTFPIMSFAFAANDTAPYSSYYINFCTVALVADGDGEMTVDFSVVATQTMVKVGASSITLEKEQSPDVWKNVKTVYGSSDPDTFYSDDAYKHTGAYIFTDLTPGVRYRVTMTGYAADRNGGDTSTATSKAKTCK